MYQHQNKLRVRYAETDRMGYAYYGNYSTYFEVGRVEALRNLNIPYKELEDEGVMLPVLEYRVKYFKPAKYDDELTVVTKVPQMPSIRIRFEYEILNERGETMTVGETTLVFADAHTGKPRKPPEKVIRAFESYFKSD